MGLLWLRAAKVFQGLDVAAGIISKEDLPNQIHRAFEAMAKVQVALYKRYALKAVKRLIKELTASYLRSKTPEEAEAAAVRIAKAAIKETFSGYPKEASSLMKSSIATIYMLSKTWGYRTGLGIEEPGDMTEAIPSRYGHTQKGLKAVSIISKAAPPLSMSFNVRDKKAIDALAKHQGWWLTKHHVVDESVNKQVNDLVRNVSFETGIPPASYRDALQSELRGHFNVAESVAGKLPMERGYYAEFLAVNTASVAKTYGSISGFREAGITNYQIVNPNDERTCQVCSYLDGNIYSVEHAEETIEKLSSGSPDDFKSLWPWTSDGSVVRSITGNPDGSNLSKAEMGKLEAAGFSLPPFHGRCRCAVEVDFSGGAGGIVWSESGKLQTEPKKELLPKAPKVSTGRKLGPADLKRHGGYWQPTGTSLNADTDLIENQVIHVRTETIDGKTRTFFRFKLTDKNAAEVRSFLIRGADENEAVTWRPFSKAVDGAAQFTKPGIIEKKAESQSFGYGARKLSYKLEPYGAEVYTVQGIEGAMTNVVEISVPTRQASHAIKAFNSVLERAQSRAGIETKIDVRTLGRMPSKEEQQRLFKIKIMGIVDRESALRLRSPDFVYNEENVKALWDKFLKKVPEGKKFLKSARMVEASPGRLAPYSEELAEYASSQGVEGYTHQWFGGSDILSQMLSDPNKAGLISSEARYSRGIFVNGLSTSTDFGTGGADSVFTRVKTNRLTSKGEIVVHIDKKAAGRLDRYSFGFDNYGKAGPADVGVRYFDSELKAKLPTIGGTNEVMFQKQIGVESFESVHTSSKYTRDTILSKLRERGVTEINGKKIEDFIVSDSTW